MKKLFMLLVIGTALWYAYSHTTLLGVRTDGSAEETAVSAEDEAGDGETADSGESVDEGEGGEESAEGDAEEADGSGDEKPGLIARLVSYVTGEDVSDDAAGEEAGEEEGGDSGEGGAMSVKDEMQAMADGTHPDERLRRDEIGVLIRGCTLTDESGNPIDFGQVLAANRDRVLVLHINNANRPHCPRKDDIRYFNFMEDFGQAYADRVTVVGINYLSPPKSVAKFKSYYHMSYPMLSFGFDKTTMFSDPVAKKKYIDKMAFRMALENGTGTVSMPLTVFITGGDHIVKRLDSFCDYEHLTSALADIEGGGNG